MKKHLKAPTLWGIFLTALYGASLPVLFYWMGAQLKGEKPMTGNEFGDLAAGIFGPLAFLWLVIGYWQQRLEIRANGEELKAQSDRIERSIAAQNLLARETVKLATAAQAQVDLMTKLVAEEEGRRLAVTGPTIDFMESLSYPTEGEIDYTIRFAIRNNPLFSWTISTSQKTIYPELEPAALTTLAPGGGVIMKFALPLGHPPWIGVTFSGRDRIGNNFKQLLSFVLGADGRWQLGDPPEPEQN